MTREEFIKQRCEIDKITLEKFKNQYRVVECNCGQPYCKGYRCLDLDDLLKENQELKSQLKGTTHCFDEEEHRELKKQLEDKEDYINKLQASKDKLNKWDYEDTMKQKKFIKYLEDMLNNENDIFSVVRVKDVLQKYKEIIGGNDVK